MYDVPMTAGTESAQKVLLSPGPVRIKEPGIVRESIQMFQMQGRDFWPKNVSGVVLVTMEKYLPLTSGHRHGNCHRPKGRIYLCATHIVAFPFILDVTKLEIQPQQTRNLSLGTTRF